MSNFKKNRYKYGFILALILVIVMTFATINLIHDMYLESRIPYSAQRLGVSINTGQQSSIEQDTGDLIDIGNTIEDVIIEKNTISNIETTTSEEDSDDSDWWPGYERIAKLMIPKINLVTDVLDEYSKQALLVSVTKFWGGEPNEVGNFCISGHNYQNKNMFSKLKKLEIGDRFFLEDNSGRTLEYEIYDIFKVDPDDTRVVSQKTNGIKEVTLITCTGDSALRIIVKGREV